MGLSSGKSPNGTSSRLYLSVPVVLLTRRLSYMTSFINDGLLTNKRVGSVLSFREEKRVPGRGYLER